MKIGEKLNPLDLGHIAVDVKGILLEYGYVMPQGSVAKLPLLPGEVQAKISEIKTAQEQYENLEEVSFYCSYCEEQNSSNWRKYTPTGEEFLACGNCTTIVEVR